MTVIKRNLVWLLVSHVATWVVSVVVLVVGPRKLGDEAFGQLSFAWVYVSFFQLIAIFGTDVFINKTVARDPEGVGRYVFNTLILKLVISGVLSFIAIALAMSLGYTREMVLIITANCLGMVLSVLNAAIVGGLGGLQRMARPAMWEVARSYTAGGLGLLVLLSDGSLLAYALVFNLAAILPLLGNGLYLWPELRVSHRVDPTLWKQIIVGGFPFFVMSALLTVYGTIDIPMLEAFAGSETVGWYVLAYRWVSMPAFFAANVGTALFPALAAEGRDVSESFVRMANKALHLVVFVATPAAVGLALVANSFLTLAYGSEFENAVPLMQLLALHIPIVGVDIILGSVAIAADRQRQWALVGASAALLNPLLNLAAIPLTISLFGNGAIGAATVTVLTEVLMMLGAIRLRPRGVLDRPTTNLLLRILVASLAMAPVVLALGSAPLLIQIVAGAVTYGIASLTLGTISPRDLRTWGLGRFGRRSRATSVMP